MTRTYCTIFDKNYLYQGVALYQSLKSHTNGFNLYALCMDETAYSLIKSMELEGLIAVHVEDILTDRHVLIADLLSAMNANDWVTATSMIAFVESDVIKVQR